MVGPGWSINPWPASVAITRLRSGYWSGYSRQGTFLQLKRDDGPPVHDTSLRSLEAYTIAAKHARGTVVVIGVGMGIMPYNLCRSQEVERAIIFEPDEALREWVRRMSAEWPGGHKLEWSDLPVAELDRTVLSRKHAVQDLPDMLYVDAQQLDQAVLAAADKAAALNRLVGARMLSWCGQEMGLMAWLTQHDVDHMQLLAYKGLDQFDRWCLHLGAVVPERSRSYMRACVRVWANLRRNEGFML